MRRFALIAFLLSTSQAWAAFSYSSPVSINAAQVPSTQTDFPVLVSFTDARFKTVGNGGHVQNSSGFDIRPYDASTGAAITGYELERYNASTGEVVMWVKVPSLSSSTTPIYLLYGDSGITTDGSSSTTWSNGFLGVYHMKDGTTLDVTSGTGTNNGTNHSATATAGQIDGAGSFVSASSQYVGLGTGYNSSLSTAITMSAWVKATSFPSATNPVIEGNDLSIAEYWALRVTSGGKIAAFLHCTGDVSYNGTGATTLSTATWYYLTLTYSTSAGMVGYVNASVDKTVAANGNITVTNAAETDIGRSPNPTSILWNGLIDEARIANTARSANWITTEYNNQNAPGTFETLGTEISIGSATVYYSPVTFLHAKVPSTQTDFPTLVSVTDTRFKSLSFGGHVTNVSGFDIRPYSDSGLSTAITGYELERYNPGTGEVVMWVKIGTLSSSSDTPIYLRYGDVSITTDGSSTTTWSNSFRSVYHLKDGTTLSVTDSVGSFNGTNSGATAADGQIDGGAAFNGASSIDTATNGTYCNNSDTTISCWLKTSTTGTNMVPISKGSSAGGWYLLKNTGNTIGMQIKDSGGTVRLSRDSVATVTDGSWHYVVATFHINTSGTGGQDVQMYIDGASNQGSLTNSAATQDLTGANFLIARRTSDLLWTGSLDEVRIATGVARSADWVATEYNNQGAPGTFETLGGESSTAANKNNWFYFFP